MAFCGGCALSMQWMCTSARMVDAGGQDIMFGCASEVTELRHASRTPDGKEREKKEREKRGEREGRREKEREREKE